MPNQDESELIAEIFQKHSNSKNVVEMLQRAQMEENSFLEPITAERSRTSRSVPRRGFTSVSRIAKG